VRAIDCRKTVTKIGGSEPKKRFALSAIVFGIAFLRPTSKNWSNSGIHQRNRKANLKIRLKKDRYFVVIE
jgi:hypothetical protein